MKNITFTFLEENTEFYAGKTIYFIKIQQDKTEPKIAQIIRETITNTFSVKDIHPLVANHCIKIIKEYIAKIYSQGYY